MTRGFTREMSRRFGVNTGLEDAVSSLPHTDLGIARLDAGALRGRQQISQAGPEEAEALLRALQRSAAHDYARVLAIGGAQLRSRQGECMSVHVA